ncbi:MAG: hypothetical protein QS721_02435 [Candidatus Endonucleobacter sp. (ex Gigantidas childressi)]|nr:hypothetical protein [Candidatus Endonucleobacter sp. (ex Gigantidas childressi)]
MIAQRSLTVNRVSEGEIDTVIGKGHSGALVTIVERVTKYTVSAQVNNKSAADVTKATISLLNPFKDSVHTITADNGKEFCTMRKSAKHYRLRFTLRTLQLLGARVK